MKVKNPVLSLSGRGKIANMGIFSRWKDVTIFRKKTDPNQPNSPAQLAQQNKYSLARLAYRNTPFTDRDISALRLYSSTYKINLNPFQFICWIYLSTFSAYPVVPLFYNCETDIIPNGKIYVRVHSLTGLYVDVVYCRERGGSRSILHLNEIGASGIYDGDITGLESGHKYYFYFDDTAQQHAPPWWGWDIGFSDDFNDGNYNGWTVTAGSWTAVPFFLKGTTDFGIITTYNVVSPLGEKEYLYKIMHAGSGLNSHVSYHYILYQTGLDFIRTALYQRDAPRNWFIFSSNVGGVFTQHHFSVKYNYIALKGSWFYVKVHKLNNSLKVKHWLSTDPEPPAWDWEGVLPPAVTDSGYFRNVSQHVDANGCGIDDIKIYYNVYHPEIPYIGGIISGLYSAPAG